MTRQEGDGSRPQSDELDADDLQFDHVEPAAAAPGAAGAEGEDEGDQTEPAGRAAPPCSRCQAPLTDAYYEASGQVYCPRCRDEYLASQTGGSRLGRAFGAISYGVFAGLGGTLIWYGVRKLTGYEVGLIAVVVGLMVGGAVRAGSGGRGGKFYQFLAVFLTYCSIVANYVPDVYVMLRDEFRKNDSAFVAGDGATTLPTTTIAAATRATTQATTGPALADVESDPQDAAVPLEGPTGEILVDEGGGDEENRLPGGILGALIALVLLCIIVFAFAFFAPILAGFENIIGLLIIGFALWEAWKLNRRQALVFNGPYAVGSMPPPVPPPAAGASPA